MKKALLFLSFVFCASFLSAQNDDLFISEYVEGYANNKALEIYNPTDAAINLSEYSLVRWSNGSTSANAEKVIQLPDVMLESEDVYVVVVDLTDMSQWDSQFDKPVWNGTNVIDTLFDVVTELPITDSLGNVVLGPQYENGSAIFDPSLYDAKYDLQSLADVFLCPDYDTNNTMYFNGNDAVGIIKGTDTTDPSMLVDVIGVIGEDPTSTIMEDAWVDVNGFWLTKDRTLVRNPDVATGRKDLSEVLFQSGGTYVGSEWTSYFKNDFSKLGWHETNFNVSTTDLNEVAFNMYPNPTNGLLTIEAEENMYGLSVYNLVGQQVKNETYDAAAGAVSVDLSDMTPGIYTVSLTFEDNKVSIQKLIVQ